jgi:hypothetical protein
MALPFTKEHTLECRFGDPVVAQIQDCIVPAVRAQEVERMLQMAILELIEAAVGVSGIHDFLAYQQFFKLRR